MKLSKSAALCAAQSFTSHQFTRCFSAVALSLAFLFSGSTKTEAARPQPPSASSSLAAVAVSSSQINLAWGASSGSVSGYKIERAPASSGTWSQIATTTASQTSYSNSGLSAGTTYFFRVRAYSRKSNSSYSNVASATTQIASDTAPPSVAITTPTNGTTFTSPQTATISASASDNVGVSKIEFFDGGILKGTDTAAPFSHNWSVSSTQNGTHSWTAKSYDAAGNAAMSGAVTVMVNIPLADTTAPSVSINSPIAGTTYTSAQTVTINASASDNVAVTKVEIYEGGVLKNTDTVAPYTHAWVVDTAGNGGYSWTAKAYDAAGNATISAAIGVTVNIPAPDSTAPTVSISSPAAGTTYTTAQTVTINASTTDNVGVSKVEFYDAGVLKGVDTLAPYSHAWSISSSVNGGHSWTAKAYDAAGNATLSSAVNLTVNVPVPDTTTPTVSITSPGAGTTYSSSQTVTISASASDNVGVTKVEFYDGGVLKSSDTLAPYSHAWSIDVVSNGAHSWTAKAYDAAGNTTSSSGISLTVNIPAADTTAPTVSITAPINGSLVKGSITLSATASDNVAVSRVEFYRDSGVLLATDATSPYSATFDTTSTPSGGHTFYAKAFDAATNTTTSSSVSITVDNTAPTVTMTAPGNGSTVSSTVTIGANAGDNVAVARVEFYCDNSMLVGTDTTAPYSCDYNTDGLENGTHTFHAKAIDTANNAAVSSSIALGVNNSATTDVPWAMGIGGVGADAAYSLTADSSGNLIVAGSFTGTVDFGGGALTSAGMGDIFVAKYSSAGSHIWSKRFGGPGDDQAGGVAADRYGDILITGYFSLTATIGANTFTSSAAKDVFVLKLSSTGAASWSKQIGGTYVSGSTDDYGYAVATDPNSGDVVITGQVAGYVNFGGGLVATTSLSTDTFLVKYSAAGAYLWAKVVSCLSDDAGRCVDIDATGNVFLAGFNRSAINLGGGTLPYFGTSALNMYVAKFSSSGSHLWSKGIGNIYRTEAYGIAADGSGNVAVTGRFMGSLNFGGTVQINGPLSSPAGYVAKLSGTTGSGLWAKTFPADLDGAGSAIAMDAAGNVIVTGNFRNNCNFGGASLASAGWHDIFVAKYATSGTHLWSQRFGGSGSDWGSSIATDSSGNVLVTGVTAGGDFSGVNLTCAGSSDVFLMKLEP